MYPLGLKSPPVYMDTNILVLVLTIFVSGESVHSFKFFTYITFKLCWSVCYLLL